MPVPRYASTSSTSPETPNGCQEDLRQAKPELFASRQVIVPEHALNGLDLIWRSDVVISGGGTMNRDAAALGVPVYSLFRGTLGAVDKHLSETGKLVLLESEQDVRDKLRLVRRERRETEADVKTLVARVMPAPQFQLRWLRALPTHGADQVDLEAGYATGVRDDHPFQSAAH